MPAKVKKPTKRRVGIRNVQNHQLTHIYKVDDVLTKIKMIRPEGDDGSFKKSKLTIFAWRYLHEQLEKIGISVDQFEAEGEDKRYYPVNEAKQLFPADCGELGVADANEITDSKDEEDDNRTCTVNIEIAYIIDGLDQVKRFIMFNSVGERKRVLKKGV